MKKIIWIILILAVGGFFVNLYMDRKAKREAKEEEAERTKQTIKLAVTKMVVQTNAIDDWEKSLTKGEQLRTDSILTVELEKVWLKNRPVLFVGSIKDISTKDQLNYSVLIERNLFVNSKYIIFNELQLSLLSNKELIDSFLIKYPNVVKGYGLDNGIAVVAHINSIRTVSVSDGENTSHEIRVGDGELIDIAYTGNLYNVLNIE
jgi:hypothetical protein